MRTWIKTFIVGMISFALVAAVPSAAQAAITSSTTSSHTKGGKCVLVSCSNYTKSVKFTARSNSQMKTIASTSKVYARTSADSYSLIYSRSITAKNTTENIWSWSIPTKYRNAKLKVVVSATFKKSGYSAGRTSTKYYWESVPAVSPE